MKFEKSAVAYDGLLPFYQQVYGSTLGEVRSAGRLGASLFLANQGAGDWSDAPVPDIVITHVNDDGFRGIADLGSGRRIIRSPGGHFGVVPPGYATTIVADAPHKLRCLAVRYSELLKLAGDDSGLPADGDFGVVHDGLRADREISCLVERIWIESAAGSPHGALWADGALLQIGAALLRLKQGAPSCRGGLPPKSLQRVMDYLETHCADDVSLLDLARIAGISAGHLCRAFKQSTGRTCSQHLVAIRMGRAKRLLADTRLPISQVAAGCGYDSPSRFALLFKRETGLSPTEWRRRL